MGVSEDRESASSDDSDSDSDDFDMNNLTVPTMQNEAESEQINEADDIREKFKQRLKVQKEEELASNPVIVGPKMDKMDIAKDSENESESESEYETDSESEENEDNNPRNRRITFLNKKQREEYYENTTKPSLDEQALILEQLEEDRLDSIKKRTVED